MGWEHFAGHCYLALDQVDDQHDDVCHAGVLLLLMMLTLIMEGFRETFSIGPPSWLCLYVVVDNDNFDIDN